MKISISPAMKLPLILAHVTLTFVMLLWLATGEVKVRIKVPPCVFYTNILEYTNSEEPRFYSTGYATENELVARHTFQMEVEQASYPAYCEGNCPDSVVVVLYSMCDTSSNYESTIVESVTIK